MMKIRLCPLYKVPGDVFRRDPALMVRWLVVPFTVFLSSFAMLFHGVTFTGK